MIDPENEKIEISEQMISEEPVSTEEVIPAGKKPQRKEKKPRVQAPEPQLAEIDQLATPQEKLQKSIEMMESSLAQSGTPNFKLFWDARKICLEFFKDPTLLNIKTLYWPKCHELTKEALRLKSVLEEQTAFAVEQIEGAVGAMENEIGDISGQLSRITPIDLPKNCTAIATHSSDYIHMQQELTLLNVYSARITGLRKELMKTEMRIRQKNQFFQRLSAAGDKIFPRRKELIKKVSETFIKDVEAFVKKSFSDGKIQGSLHDCREEIKALQQIAKLLNLNTHAFNVTRTKLSDCWDKLKVAEHDLKAARHEKKEEHQKNAELVIAKIHSFEEAVQKGELANNELQNQHQEIVQYMRSVELGRPEVKSLRDQLEAAFKPIADKKKEEEKRKRDEAQEKAKKRKDQAAEAQSGIDEILENLGGFNAEELKNKFEEVLNKAENAKLSDDEREKFNLSKKRLEDAIGDKEEEELLDQPLTQEVLDKLEARLDERLGKRYEIKQRIEKFRKMSGVSGLDFKQSMLYNEMMHAEKERLEKFNRQIELLDSAIHE